VSAELSQDEFHGALKRLLVLASMADEEIDPEEVERLQKAYRTLTALELTESDLFDELSELQNRPVTADEMIRSLAPRLDWDRKQTLLKAVIVVSTADRAVKDEERLFIESVASALAQDPQELERLIRAVEFDPEAP
jgi:tellurite resistance protein